MPVTVLLADDSGPVRDAIKQLLRSEPQIQLLGETDSFGETLLQIANLKPDVVVMDLCMPDSSSFAPAFVNSILSDHPHRRVAMSFAFDEESKAVARTYGCERVLDKTKLADELIPAILAR